MGQKRCGLCDEELTCTDCGTGSVYSCAEHGVRDWVFAGQGGTGSVMRLPSLAGGTEPRAKPAAPATSFSGLPSRAPFRKPPRFAP